MELEKRNLAIKLTSHVLSWLRLRNLAPNSDFDFHPFSANEKLQNNKLDQDVNYYLDQVSFLETNYYVPAEVKLIKFFNSIHFI